MSDNQTGSPIAFAVTPDQRRLIEMAAEKEHRSISSYIRWVLIPAAERTLADRDTSTARLNPAQAA
jgi:uncharacterized protein (DUF1778 family)